MELKIYDKQGIVKMTVSPDNSSQWNHEVGVENVVTVNFTTWEFLVLEVGWYILVEGQRFSIKSEYRPKHIHDTKYTYNLKFYGREHDTQDILFCRLNQGEDDLESVFAYDGTPMEFLNKVVANMNRNSDGVVWKAGETITANRQTINFNGLYCWDALGEIARTFGTEWWMDGEYVNLSKCIRGESVLLGYGQGLKSGLTQNENTNAVKWFTRLIPVGSSKNIDKSKYGYATLQLPGREKYIDINTQYGLKEYREEAAFSEIYPHRVGTISSVRSEERTNEETGNYTVYYVKDSSLPFNPDEYMIGGEVIHMTFNNGALSGKDFEVNWNNETKEFEIINQYPDENTQLPGGNLVPSADDTYVLWNISMPDEYIRAAEQELKTAVDVYLAEYSKDISVYSGSTDYIYISKNDVPLLLGQRVRLLSEIYFGNIGRDSRITRVSRKLNNLNEATIDCSDAIASSWKSSVDSSLNQLQFAVAQEVLQSTIEILKTGDTRTPSEYNVFSSLRTVIDFLSKKKDDKTPHNFGVGKNLTVDKEVVVGESIHSKTFNSGFTSGQGWSIRNKKWTNASNEVETRSIAEFDELIVRGVMRVYEFIISQMLGENDNRIFTGMMEVDHYDAGEGKIYLKTGDGRLYNPFRADDIVIVQQYCGNPSENNGYYVTKQYELVVTEAGVGEGGEERLDWVKFRNFTTSMEGGDESLIVEHDTLVRIDNLSDMSRKGIIQLMSVGEDTPYMDFVYGAKTDPENSLKGRLGNLGGVYNPLFGWLKEFGAYLTNLYAVGEFVIAHTGEDVSDAIEIAKSGFRTNYRQTTYDMTEEQNFLTNASMTNNCEGWTFGEDFSDYFLVDGLPQYFNYDLYVSEKTYAGLAKYNDRDMLRVFSSSARQENSLIRKPSTHKVYTGVTENEDGSSESVYTEEIDTIYLNIRFYCHASGELEMGFVDVNGVFYDNVFHSKKDYVADIDAYTISVSGKWDGMGDFYIKTTGDFYIDLLSLTDKPLENYMITTSTAIEQDAARISLLGKKVNGVEGSVTELSLTVNAQEGTISSLVETTDSIDNTIKNAGWINRDDSVSIFAEQVNEQGLATKAEMEVYVDGIVSGIRISADQIDMTANDYISIINKGTTTIAAERVDLKGKVTFSMLDNETQDNIDSKVDQDAVNDSIDDFKGTIIEGGKIKTELLYVTEIEATKGSVGGFTIGEKSLTNDDADAYISVGDLTGTSFVSINAPSASGALSVRRDDGVAVSIYTHGSEGVGLRINGQTGAKTIESYGSSVLAARKGSSPYEVVTIAGLALSYKNGKDFSVASNSVFDSVNSVWADFLVATGDVTLPSASSCQGKILFVKFMGNYTISSASPIVDGSSMETLYTKTYNERSVFFLNDGIRWYAFDGWYK